MRLFGRKKDAAQPVEMREGWLAECGPACGFMVRNHAQKEAAEMLKLHVKGTHKQNMTQKDAMAGLKATSWPVTAVVENVG